MKKIYKKVAIASAIAATLITQNTNIQHKQILKAENQNGQTHATTSSPVVTPVNDVMQFLNTFSNHGNNNNLQFSDYDKFNQLRQNIANVVSHFPKEQYNTFKNSFTKIWNENQNNDLKSDGVSNVSPFTTFSNYFTYMNLYYTSYGIFLDHFKITNFQTQSEISSGTKTLTQDELNKAKAEYERLFAWGDNITGKYTITGVEQQAGSNYVIPIIHVTDAQEFSWKTGNIPQYYGPVKLTGDGVAGTYFTITPAMSDGTEHALPVVAQHVANGIEPVEEINNKLYSFSSLDSHGQETTFSPTITGLQNTTNFKDGMNSTYEVNGSWIFANDAVKNRLLPVNRLFNGRQLLDYTRGNEHGLQLNAGVVLESASFADIMKQFTLIQEVTTKIDVAIYSNGQRRKIGELVTHTIGNSEPYTTFKLLPDSAPKGSTGNVEIMPSDIKRWVNSNLFGDIKIDSNSNGNIHLTGLKLFGQTESSAIYNSIKNQINNLGIVDGEYKFEIVQKKTFTNKVQGLPTGISLGEFLTTNSIGFKEITPEIISALNTAGYHFDFNATKYTNTNGDYIQTFKIVPNEEVKHIQIPVSLNVDGKPTGNMDNLKFTITNTTNSVMEFGAPVNAVSINLGINSGESESLYRTRLAGLGYYVKTFNGADTIISKVTTTNTTHQSISDILSTRDSNKFVQYFGSDWKESIVNKVLTSPSLNKTFTFLGFKVNNESTYQKQVVIDENTRSIELDLSSSYSIPVEVKDQNGNIIVVNGHQMTGRVTFGVQNGKKTVIVDPNSELGKHFDVKIEQNAGTNDKLLLLFVPKGMASQTLTSQGMYAYTVDQGQWRDQYKLDSFFRQYEIKTYTVDNGLAQMATNTLTPHAIDGAMHGDSFGIA